MPRRSSQAPGAGSDPPSVEIAGVVAKLVALDTATLRAEWLRLNRRPPPADLTRDLLLRGVAHCLQTAAYGGLSHAATSRLDALGATRAGRTALQRRTGQLQLRPGTSLVRGWQGQTHTVVARDSGFEYRGRLYRSLSLIACEITGAHWSGPRFFGLARKPGSANSGATVNGDG